MTTRDLPDYIQEIVIRYAGGFIGLEELAARLGSIVPWDMKGNIVLAENFESELTEWTDESDDIGSSAVRSSRHKYSGDWSLKLYKAGLAGAEVASLRTFHFPGTTKYAAFARFCWDENCQTLQLCCGFITGSEEFIIRVQYNLPATTLTVNTTDDIAHEITTALTLGEVVYTWYPVLVTFDLATGYYDKLYFAGKEYDISDVPLYSEPSEDPPLGYVYIYAHRVSDDAFTAYVDDIILAKNVP